MIEKISNVVTNVVKEPAFGLHWLNHTAFLAQLLRERRVGSILDTGRVEEGKR